MERNRSAAYIKYIYLVRHQKPLSVHHITLILLRNRRKFAGSYCIHLFLLDILSCWCLINVRCIFIYSFFCCCCSLSWCTVRHIAWYANEVAMPKGVRNTKSQQSTINEKYCHFLCGKTKSIFSVAYAMQLPCSLHVSFLVGTFSLLIKLENCHICHDNNRDELDENETENCSSFYVFAQSINGTEWFRFYACLCWQ